MKKVAKIIIGAVVSLFGLLVTAGFIYDFLGLVYKAQKDHGLRPATKADIKRMGIKGCARSKIDSGEEIFKDVEEGWKWAQSR